MSELLADLYGHQAWADAEFWRALDAAPAALADEVILKRLHHIHTVQRAFFSLAKGERPAFKRFEEFTDTKVLRAYAQEYHSAVLPFISSLEDAALSRPLTVPWFRHPSLTVTTGQGLLQAALHSQWHRGQNATRLRELGGEPPLVDFIAWYWKGKPEAIWT